jgi:hypothetical protein
MNVIANAILGFKVLHIFNAMLPIEVYTFKSLIKVSAQIKQGS